MCSEGMRIGVRCDAETCEFRNIRIKIEKKQKRFVVCKKRKIAVARKYQTEFAPKASFYRYVKTNNYRSENLI